MDFFRFERCDSQQPDFRSLVGFLDAELRDFDGDDHPFYDQYNQLDKINHCLVAYRGTQTVGCGALRAIDSASVEIKRMYTLPDFRGKGVASGLLTALENWALELQFKTAVLETGKKQQQAVSLYLKSGYEIIENYGPYVGIENSICMKKILK